MHGCAVVDHPHRLPFDFGEEEIMSYDRVRTLLIDFDASMDALRLQLSDSSPIKASFDGARSVYPLTQNRLPDLTPWSIVIESASRSRTGGILSIRGEARTRPRT